MASRNLPMLALTLLLLSVTIPSAAPLSFNLASFKTNDGDVEVHGDACVYDGRIQLTNDKGNKLQVDCSGQAVYHKPLALWDKASGENSSFTTHFSFSINSRNQDRHGDGFAFFITHPDLPFPVPRAKEGSGRILNSTSYPFVAVEFLTFPNGEERVGIVDMKSLNSSAKARWCRDVSDRQEDEAWVRYDSASKNLSVSFYGFCNHTKTNHVIGYEVDLRTVLPESVRFGFSASTGRNFDRHAIKSWSFSSSLTTAPKGRSIDKGLVAGLGAGGGVAVLISGLGVIWHVYIKRRTNEEEDFDLAMDEDFEKGTGPKRFSYIELARATNDFSEDEKLGEGGFGGVYKGYLKELNSYIAVKKVSEGSKQGVKEYASEVRIVSRLRHKNLVQLIGWCHERRGLLLVYEFMPNGSLDSHLFKEQSKLSWTQRYRIVQGLASALLYLHEEWEQCVLHRDVKSSNIMLDSSFTAKLGDFGLARLVDHAKGWQTTHLAGTLGYMAPESYGTGKASKESDVYSFGVVALEIACGRKPYNPKAEESQRVLVHWVWELYGSEHLVEAADPGLCGEFDEQEMKKLMMVGIWCAHPDHRLRPSVRQAIQALNGEVLVPVLPSKMPVPTYTSAPDPLVNASPGRLTFSTMDPR